MAGEAKVLPDGRVQLPSGAILDPSTPDGQGRLFNAGRQRIDDPTGQFDQHAQRRQQAAANGDINAGDAIALNALLGSLPDDQVGAITGYNAGGFQGGYYDLPEPTRRAIENKTAANGGGQLTQPRGSDVATYGIGQAEQIGLEGVRQNEQDLGNLGWMNLGITAENNGLTQANRGWTDWQYGRDQEYVGQSQSLVDQLGQLTRDANAYQTGITGQYQNDLRGLSAGNTQLLGNLQNTFNQVGGPMQSSVRWQGDLTSQAAQAQADPRAIQAQYEALGFQNAAMYGALDYQSQGALARADASAIRAQESALQNLQHASQGSLDGHSRAAGAYADFADIANQRNAATELQNIANGTNDVSLYKLDGYRELVGAMGGDYDYDFDDSEGAGYLRDLMRGKSDVTAERVRVGQEDPEAYAAMQSALRQYGELTTPEVTAAERFIYEQARQQQEQDERNTRAAISSNLRARGMGGSGAELTQSALAGQQTSQNRLLSDLGAQANAIERSMQALGGYSDLSSVMSAQANQIGMTNADRALQAAMSNQDIRASAAGQFAGLQTQTGMGNMDRRYDANRTLLGTASDIAQGNMDRRTQGAGMAYDAMSDIRAQGFAEEYSRGQAADAMTTANMNRRLESMGLESNAAARLREQSFHESYSRGMAADQASANNQRTRLQASADYATNASNMRNSSFNEAFSRGSAADQTAQWNREQSLSVQKWNHEFAANERDSYWNRANDLTGRGLQVSELNARNSSDIYNSGRELTNDTYNRNQGVLQAQDVVNGRRNTADTTYATGQRQANNDTIANNDAFWNRTANVTGSNIQNRNQGTQIRMDAQGQRGQVALAEQARGEADANRAAAERQANSQGLLGTPILSGNGILGIEGVPFL